MTRGSKHPYKYSWGSGEEKTYRRRFRLFGPPAKWSLFMDQQIHQHLFLPSEQKSEQLFLTCNINNLIYFLLRTHLLLHGSKSGDPHAFRSVVCVWGKCEKEHSIKPIFCTIDPTIVLFLSLCFLSLFLSSSPVWKCYWRWRGVKLLSKC